MVQKMKNIFLYAGTDKESFAQVKSRIDKRNRKLVTTLSAVATALILVMLFSSFKAEGFSQNRIVYELGLVMSVLTLIISVTVAKKYHAMVAVSVHAAYAIYYMYGILIGAVTDPTGKTVTFIAMLVFMPIVFTNRPIRIIGTTTLYVAIFVVLCLSHKQGKLLTVDIVDAIIFGILGAVCGTMVSVNEVTKNVYEQMIEETSRIDQLTQVRNRNAFEFERFSIPNKCQSSIGCLYVDVNGLHELNNEKGHDAGDEMLQFVASKIAQYISKDYTYRTGGDEFVAFVIDPDDSVVWRNIDEMVGEIENEDYHVAYGMEISGTHRLRLGDLIRRAEARMEASKKQYYKDLAREMRN